MRREGAKFGFIRHCASPVAKGAQEISIMVRGGATRSEGLTTITLSRGVSGTLLPRISGVHLGSLISLCEGRRFQALGRSACHEGDTIYGALVGVLSPRVCISGLATNCVHRQFLGANQRRDALGR